MKDGLTHHSDCGTVKNRSFTIEGSTAIHSVVIILGIKYRNRAIGINSEIGHNTIRARQYNIKTEEEKERNDSLYICCLTIQSVVDNRENCKSIE